jgi:nicotinate-nucleotide pyrophosphorylase (carboxylating)
MTQEFSIQLKQLIQQALQEDIGKADYSTLSCIPKSAKGKAILKIKENGILAGVDVAQIIFNLVEPDAEIVSFKKDGNEMQQGEKAFEINALIHTILSCERVVLNCMQRMSGIATLTNEFTQKLKGYHTQLLDTRKTTPNFRLLEKEAVRIGGAVNHRFGLYDMIMLKDNHIDYCGGIDKAINTSWNYLQENNLSLKIEIETRNIEDVRKVCAVGKGKVFRIMLDNFSPSQVSEALKIINKEFETEASGGININTIESFAETGVDYVSVGGLIHQARSLDLSLKAVIVN